MSMEYRLDARGLICPLPVLKARKALMGMSAGDILRVLVTDGAALADFRLFCAEAGHVLRSIAPSGDGMEVIVEAGAP